MRVAAVILNYRTAELTINCLRSLTGEVKGEADVRVTVVDNASGDESARAIRQAIDANGWAGWADLLPLARNVGFARGNNAAILSAWGRKPEYFLLLNSDTQVRPGAVRTLVEFMDQHPEAGIAGSRLEHPDGTPQHAAFRFPSVWGELEAGCRFGPLSRLLRSAVVAPPIRAEAHRTEWVPGAAMIIRREVLEQVGLLDERYFMYYEDVDFCRAAANAGWEVWYVPQARVVHLVGRSSGVNDVAVRQRMPRYWFEARRRYFVRNHGRRYAVAAEVCWLTGYATWRVRRVLQRRPDNDPPRMLWDTLRWSLWPTLAGR